MQEKLVTVIMPAYNAERYIQMSIVSVLQQTYKNIELIIVNDGSSDGTGDIMQKWADIWPDRVKIYMRERNGGTAAALNDALERAKGDYICWLSADDLYCDDMVESGVKFLSHHKEVDAVFSRCAYIDENSRFVGELSYASYDEYIRVGMAGIVAILLHGNFWHGCTVFAKAECFQREERFNINYKASQDYDFWVRMAADYDFGYLDQVNVLSRRHSGQGSNYLNCNADEARVFFNLLCREDIMKKLYRKMNMEYSYENIKPLIEYRIQKNKGREEEMKVISEGIRRYMGMMENGDIHFQS